MKRKLLIIVSFFLVWGLAACNASGDITKNDFNSGIVKDYFKANAFELEEDEFELTTDLTSDSFSAVGNVFYRTYDGSDYTYFTAYDNSEIAVQADNANNAFGYYLNDNYVVAIQDGTDFDVYAFDGTKLATVEDDGMSPINVVSNVQTNYEVHQVQYGSENIGYIIFAKDHDARIVTMSDYDDFDLNEYLSEVTGVSFDKVANKSYFPLFEDLNDEYYYRLNANTVSVYSESDNKLVNMFNQSIFVPAANKVTVYFDRVLLSQTVDQLPDDAIEYDLYQSGNKYNITTTFYNIITDTTTELEANFILTTANNGATDTNSEDEFFEIVIDVIEERVVTKTAVPAVIKSDGSIGLNPFPYQSAVSYYENYYYDPTTAVLLDKDFNLVYDSVINVDFENQVYYRYANSNLSIHTLEDNEVVFEGEYTLDSINKNGAIIHDDENEYFFYSHETQLETSMFDDDQDPIRVYGSVIITYKSTDNVLRLYDCLTGEVVETFDVPSADVAQLEADILASTVSVASILRTNDYLGFESRYYRIALSSSEVTFIYTLNKVEAPEE